MTRQLRRAVCAVVTVLAAVLSLTGCLSAPGSTTAADPNAIKIGTLRGQPHLFAPYFMQQFAADGMQYEIVLFDNSPDLKNAIVSGAIDYAALGVPSVLAGVAAGEDLRLIASAADGGYGFVGRTDIAGPADLRGRTIAYPAGATQEILLKLLLTANGLDYRSDVNLVSLPFSDMAKAYQSGQIDAFLGAEVGPSIALHHGAHELISPYDTPIGGVNIGFATRASLIERDPAQVQQVVNSLARANDHLKAHPGEWAQRVVEQFGLDPEVTATALTNIEPRWALDAEYRGRVTALAEQMVAFDQISRAPDLRKVFDTTFVDAVTGPQ